MLNCSSRSSVKLHIWSLQFLAFMRVLEVEPHGCQGPTCTWKKLFPYNAMGMTYVHPPIPTFSLPVARHVSKQDSRHTRTLPKLLCFYEYNPQGAIKQAVHCPVPQLPKAYSALQWERRVQGGEEWGNDTWKSSVYILKLAWCLGKSTKKTKTKNLPTTNQRAIPKNLRSLEELIQQQLYLFNLSNYHIIKCMNYKRAKALN